jgi:chromatin segregation and condensation protein Rec8/ScpA/Scc1 (kleisin family)
MHGVMTFLAGLELTRSGVLFLRQSQPFSELWLYRREEDEDEVSSDIEVIEVDS